LPTADGFINIGVGGEGQWKAFCKAIGMPALATHPDYATMALRFEHRPQLRGILEPLFKTKTSETWRRELATAGVPAGPIHKMDAVFADPQVQHLAIAETVHHPVRGDVKLIGQPVVLSRTPAKVVSAIPEKGAHTDEILAEFGFAAAEIDALKSAKIV
jgi:crotonobetainyl-CoA:carnitine CoA-transferase CaiB-like acyl-CoA transferase